MVAGGGGRSMGEVPTDAIGAMPVDHDADAMTACSGGFRVLIEGGGPTTLIAGDDTWTTIDTTAAGTALLLDFGVPPLTVGVPCLTIVGATAAR